MARQEESTDETAGSRPLPSLVMDELALAPTRASELLEVEDSAGESSIGHPGGQNQLAWEQNRTGKCQVRKSPAEMLLGTQCLFQHCPWLIQVKEQGPSNFSG
jgi:hypothetical protein